MELKSILFPYEGVLKLPTAKPPEQPLDRLSAISGLGSSTVAPERKKAPSAFGLDLTPEGAARVMPESAFAKEYKAGLQEQTERHQRLDLVLQQGKKLDNPNVVKSLIDRGLITPSELAILKASKLHDPMAYRTERERIAKTEEAYGLIGDKKNTPVQKEEADRKKKQIDFEKNQELAGIRRRIERVLGNRGIDFNNPAHVQRLIDTGQLTGAEITEMRDLRLDRIGMIRDRADLESRIVEVVERVQKLQQEPSGKTEEAERQLKFGSSPQPENSVRTVVEGTQRAAETAVSAVKGGEILRLIKAHRKELLILAAGTLAVAGGVALARRTGAMEAGIRAATRFAGELRQGKGVTEIIGGITALGKLGEVARGLRPAETSEATVPPAIAEVAPVAETAEETDKDEQKERLEERLSDPDKRRSSLSEWGSAAIMSAYGLAEGLQMLKNFGKRIALNAVNDMV